MASAGPSKEGGGHKPGEKPPKKNDLKIQMDNFMKMAAYMNKNTFSSVTTLPPEENRLYIGSNISKNRLPLWQKDGDNDARRNREPGETAERDQFMKDQMMGVGLDADTEKFFRCKKCGQGTIILKQARRSF